MGMLSSRIITNASTLMFDEKHLIVYWFCEKKIIFIFFKNNKTIIYAKFIKSQIQFTF